MIHGQLNRNQLKEMQDALSRFDLPPQKRQRLLWRMAKYGLIDSAKRHIRNQQSPDGESWPARKSPRRQKMLRNMPKLLHIREMPEIDAVRIYLQGGHYRNGKQPVPAGVVGYAQQNGMRFQITRQQVKKNVDRERMATIKQAKKLRTLGYKVKKGKRWRKPAIKEITANMKFIQAGTLIRVLSGEETKSKWEITIPSRAFLGMNEEEFSKALARQLQGIGYGA
ncbi:phage virion morphogenesis protein [Xenorhabdus doucetiae]|uniref:Putative phage protein n=1 Tax=Xenorhabdus doucetiae TaxID=351671 RepID=A0A068QVZ3_9GAMM|nr:phage virion morphogenesis protein [Xenorhabdus doucetiae]TYO98378.1 virion morphogenesis family protein [Xenorhabdus doucetiae]CDG19128.1 putative phage gene [Xenorhabdus doucetiae]